MDSFSRRERVLKKFDYICQYCGVPIRHDTYSRDHIVPVAKGAVKYENNLILCCTTCNGRKEKKSLESFRAMLYEEVYNALIFVESKLLRWNSFSPSPDQERAERAAMIAELSGQLQKILSMTGVRFPIDEKLKDFARKKNGRHSGA